MGKYVDRNFIRKLSNQYYQKQRKHASYCRCIHCKRYFNLQNEKERWSFNTLNFLHNRWFYIFNKKNNVCCLFPVFI